MGEIFASMFVNALFRSSERSQNYMVFRIGLVSPMIYLQMFKYNGVSLKQVRQMRYEIGFLLDLLIEENF